MCHCEQTTCRIVTKEDLFTCLELASLGNMFNINLEYRHFGIKKQSEKSTKLSGAFFL